MIIDYSTARPSIAELKAAEVTAVGRYIGWDGQPGYSNIGKNLTEAEARTLLNAGIDIFLAFEYSAAEALYGAAQGAKDAALAARQLTELGAPAGMTVYFALDFDIKDYAPGLPDTATNARAKLGPAGHYLEAINAAEPEYGVGIYGGYWAVSRALDAGLATMAWQTIAWSGGQWDSRAVLRQQVTQVLGGDVNILTAHVNDFGQWPRPDVSAIRYTADGTKSIDEVAALESRRLGRHVTVWEIAEVSHAHMTEANKLAMLRYALWPGRDKPMREGLVYWVPAR